ncbi:hypothetical protein ACFL4N_05965 [Thermodesulfobacteriota bacterium]
MEPVRGDKDPKQVEAEVVLAEEDVVKAGEAVSRQVRAVIVFAQTVGRKPTINWEAPVMSRNVPNAEWR